MDLNKTETKQKLVDLKAERTDFRRQINEAMELVKSLMATRKALNLEIRRVTEYYATHWRDDDNPKAETTDGVQRWT